MSGISRNCKTILNSKFYEKKVLLLGKINLFSYLFYINSNYSKKKLAISELFRGFGILGSRI